MQTGRRKGLWRHLWPERKPCSCVGSRWLPARGSLQIKTALQSPVPPPSLILSDDSFQSLFPNCCLSSLGAQVPRSAKLKCRNLLRFILWISITWDKKLGLIYILSYRELSELVDYYCTKLCGLACQHLTSSSLHRFFFFFFWLQYSFPTDWWRRMQFKQKYGIWHIPDLSKG